MGSTRVVHSADGSLYDWNEYEPFGTILRSGGGQLSSDRLSYIGKEKDSESDLGDFGVRKYEAETGRFLSVDPLWEEQRPWNVYHYSANNPIVAKDSDGKLFNFAAAGAGGGLAGGIVGKAITEYTEKATIVATVIAGKAQGEIIKKTTEVVASKAASAARSATSTATSKVLNEVAGTNKNSGQNNKKNK